MTDSFVDWFSTHGALVTGLSILSLLLLAVTVVATPWLLARLPADYFALQARPGPQRSVAVRVALMLARNFLGIVFIVLGVVMFVTPGPGLVALLIGLSLCEFPGKRRLVRWLASRPSVYATLNWLRRRAGTEPFEYPHDVH